MVTDATQYPRMETEPKYAPDSFTRMITVDAQDRGATRSARMERAELPDAVTGHCVA
ncbi:hypothetical protein BRAS3843_2770005 [Bradyrhizobium sp. STM 3843]|nr:hypothetical protein BRAS3843_2770005 [Bradyrhizobium sp. STM 3843]